MFQPFVSFLYSKVSKLTRPKKLSVTLLVKKQWILPLLLLLSVSACAHKTPSVPFQPLPEGPLSLVVNVDGLRCCNGVLRLAVYNDADYWLSNTDMVRGRLGFILGESQTFEIHGLPAGKYAVAVFQDNDSDNKLDRWLGILPKEPYGFSNNVGKYGPVSFNQAAFELTEDKTISIQLNSL